MRRRNMQIRRARRMMAARYRHEILSPSALMREVSCAYAKIAEGLVIMTMHRLIEAGVIIESEPEEDKFE